MKVLIVGQYFWPENFRINEVAESLDRAGCTVTALTGPPNYPDGKVLPGYSALSCSSERKGNVLIYRVPQVPRGSGGAVRLLLNYLTFVISACVFGPWLLRRQRFDVVLVYAPGPILQAIPGLLLGAIKHAPVITWVQDLWPDSLKVTGFVRNQTALKTVSLIVKWVYRCSDLLLVQSRSFIEPVRTMADRTPVIYHPNPGELPLEQSAALGEPALRLKSGFNVVFAGNLGTVQSLETILKAAEMTRHETDIWWVLVGSGSRSGWLLDEVQRRGLSQVVLPGRFGPEAMPKILMQASVLLVTLVRSPIMSLTIPSKVQAYLAAARPVIACLDGEGARVIQEAGAGIACPAEDAEALARAVVQLREMPAASLTRMGEAGRRYYLENFDPAVLTQQLLRLFEGAVTERSLHSRNN